MNSLTNTIDQSRHSTVINKNGYENIPINIVGAGATGSHLFDLLLCMGWNKISVYDFDHVERHNLANQLYSTRDIGELKVDGLKRHTEEKLGEVPDNYDFLNTKVDKDKVGYLNGIVFLCMDTFSSRKEVMEGLIHMDRPNWLFFMDSRMGSVRAKIYTATFGRLDQYKAILNTLGSDDDSSYEVSPCGTSISVKATVMALVAQMKWEMLNRVMYDQEAYGWDINMSPFPNIRELTL